MSKLELDKVEERIRSEIETMLVEKKLDMMFVMLTDILNESTYLIYSGDEAAALAAESFGCAESEAGLTLKGVVSRKKQLIPAIINTLAER